MDFKIYISGCSVVVIVFEATTAVAAAGTCATAVCAFAKKRRLQQS